VGSNLILVGPSGSDAQPNEVWVSNGTVGSETELLLAGGDVGGFVRIGGEAFFSVNGDDLWVSDGALAGSHLLASFNTLSDLTADGSQLLFSASNLGSNTEPWVSDGTVAGTHLITNIVAPGPGQLSVSQTSGFGARLIFTAHVGGLSTVWVSDGTPDGTAALPASVLTVNPQIVTAGGKAYFTVFDGESGTPLWVYTGSGGPGSIGSDLDFQVAPSLLTAFGSQFVFYDTFAGPKATSRFGGGGLFATDGTDAGTVRITADTVVSQPGVLGGELLFLGSSGSQTGLFESNGTANSAVFVAAAPTTDATGTFVVSGAKAFFVTGDNTTGAELWVTDGTSGGTHLVEDIAAGFPGSNPAALTPFNGGVIFTATDSQRGTQVWFSDGTLAGTYELAVNQTRDPSAELEVGSAFTLGGATYVVAYTVTFNGSTFPIFQTELLRTDGTAAGTSLAALVDGESGVNFGAVQLLNATQAIFDIQGQQLWITDGTSTGTFQVSGNFVFPESLPVVIGGSAYFAAADNGLPFADLFVTSGANGAATDLAFDISNVFSGGGEVFYTAPASGQNMSALFAYQPTSHQITSLTTFAAGLPIGFVVENGGQAQLGSPQGAQVAQLWVTDGTAAGTKQLAGAPGNSEFSDFTALGGKVYFGSFFSSTAANQGLWVTDGTVAGTHEILNVDVLSNTLEVVGGDLLFLATDSGNRTAGWSYNPSTGIATESAPTAVASLPTDFVVAGSTGYFVADDATSRGELWKVTGADVVTELTSPSNGELGEGQANTIALAARGDGLFFSADDAVHGPSLFFTDGSDVTFLAQVQNADDFTVIGNLLYFQGNDPTNGDELWVSDGSPGGTHRVSDTEAANSANASGFISVAGKMFFSANDGIHGQELWAFNGQPGGATMVADINPGAGDSSPTDLTAFGAALFFAASNGAGAPELWRSDGAAGGTTAVTSAGNGASPQELTADGAQLFFFGDDSVHGAGLFVTDGSAGGTSFVRSFTAVADMTVEGGRLYFQGTDSSAGTELWTSDGTAAGTTRLSVTGPSSGGNPAEFTPVGASPAAPHDFNGDGHTDLLIQNAAGAVDVGSISDGQTAFAQVTALGPEWSFRGVGDFLGVGHAQFLIENSAGAVDVGDVSGSQVAYTQVTALGSEWSFRGAGDFLSEGKDEFLIENAAGAVVVADVVGGHASFTTVGGLGSEWSFHGAGDFLGDGKDDFLIQNSAGAVAFGEVANGAATYTAATALGPEWKFVGAGEFLGDGHDQFLIENTAGAVDVGDWNGGHVTFTQLTALGPEWKFVGAGDYLGEGHDQFLIENTAGAVDVADWTNGQIHFTQATALGSEWSFH
jgi:ELWxxDGT repeat protein